MQKSVDNPTGNLCPLLFCFRYFPALSESLVEDMSLPFLCRDFKVVGRLANDLQKPLRLFGQFQSCLPSAAQQTDPNSKGTH